MKFCVLMLVTISSFVRFGTEAMFKGSSANYREYPFMVQLLTKRYDDACSGSLISLNHILSTARCFLSTPARYALAGEILGLFIIKHQIPHIRAKLRKIVKHIAHPKALKFYHDKKVYNVEWDLAVMKVKEPFRQSSHVAPVIIATNLPSKNEEFLLIGFGCNSTNTSTKGVLRSALVVVDMRHSLTNIYPTSLLAKFKESGGKPCSGDAGGSLYSKKSKRLYGTLFGQIDESPFYVAFANAVNKERYDWIMDIIDKSKKTEKPKGKYNETKTFHEEKRNTSNEDHRGSPTNRKVPPKSKSKNYTNMPKCLAFRRLSYDKPKDFISIGIFAILLSSIIAF